MKLTECTVQLVDGSSDRYQLLIRVHEPGYYVGCVKYADTILGLKELVILSLLGRSLVFLYYE